MPRLARADDLAAVHAIYMHPRVVPYLGIDPLPLDAFRAEFERLRQGDGFFVLERDGALLGFCRATRQSGRSAHVALLGTFAMAPETHGSGLARELVDAVIARLAGQGVRRVELQVEADNLRAQAFYRKLGFVLEGRLRGAYKRATDAHYTDELLLAKVLDPLVRTPVAGSGAVRHDAPCEVRPAQREDLAGWASMRAALWPDEDATVLADEAVAWFDEGVPHLAAVLVAHRGQTRIGFAELNLRPYAEGCGSSPVAFLEGWFVAPSQRERGVGSALLRAAEAWGRAQGCREFASDALLDNEASRAAHLALGFEEVEVIRCFRKSL